MSLITGPDIRDGLVLDKLAQALCEALPEKCKANLKSPAFPTTLTWVSMCTGSGGDRFVAAALQHALKTVLQVEIEFSTACVCESNPKKRDFLQEVYGCRTCIFQDVAHMQNKAGA